MTFWCRRWIEQSRSPRWTMLPWRVAEHLDLDVARPDDRALEVHGVVAERAAGLALGAVERGGELGRALHQAHALAAAAGRGLDHHREADLVGRSQRGRSVGEALAVGAVVARHHRRAGGAHRLPRLGLVAHLEDGLGRRADEGDARRRAGLGEVFVLRQEAVAGVDGVGAALGAGGEDLVDAQVALARRRRPDGHRVVGGEHVSRGTIGVAVHRDRLQAALAAGAHDPDRDLAAVGHEHTPEGTNGDGWHIRGT
jgi:hypothetical protein